MVSIGDIYKYIDEIAPFEAAMGYDNVGIIVGDSSVQVSNVLVALDATRDVIAEAKNLSAQLIITHHPIIFSPIKSIKSGDMVCELIKSDIGLIAAHTNLDLAPKYGVNVCLAEKLELKGIISMREFGLIGDLSFEMNTRKFANFVAEKLNVRGLRFNGIEKDIKKVAVCSGSGGSLVDEAYEYGADAFVLGEIKHHEILRANDLRMVVVDVGHFMSENVVVPSLVKILNERFSDVIFHVSNKCDDMMEYYVI